MTDSSQREAALSPWKRALLTIRRLQAKVAQLERARAEPVAVVGMACHFPGSGDSADGLWRSLCDGAHAIREVPRDRWDISRYYHADPDTPGKMTTRWGAFVSGVDQFDADFFGVSPREAAAMDPQHRLFLEVAWEALEAAALPADKLAESSTGVFLGMNTTDYFTRQISGGDDDGPNAYMATGNNYSVAAGRLSFLLGLRGPAIAVDTACSSSLVALHIACGSLRNSECSLAIVGGVQLALSPEYTIMFSKARMMSPDGRCWTLDAAANGYVRGEGCGVVVLRRLSEAIAAGDNIQAIILNTAINQDGRTSSLTAPSGPAQQDVIRAALAKADVEASDVDYVELHGTGTPLGDPIETQALGEVMAGRSERLAVGAIKTNIGHLEAAAGVAGLAKVILALEREELPPHLGLSRINPHIPLSHLPLVATTGSVPWVRTEQRRVAGISSFAYQGTNAHAIVAEAPTLEVERGEVRPYQLLTLSAKSEPALKALAERYRNHLESRPQDTLADVCLTTQIGRAHFSHRAAIVAETTEAAISKLATLIGSTQRAEMKPRRTRPKIAFLFSGHGAFAGMGHELHQTEPVFREALEQCESILAPIIDRPLRDMMFDARSKLLDQPRYAEPALFALQYALVQLWDAWGVRPTAVHGHGLGEYVAACVAGVYSVEDGLKLVAERGRLIQQLASEGTMAAVFGSEARIAAALTPESGVSIAALNGPRNAVISGPVAGIQEIRSTLERAGVRTRSLEVSHALHSSVMEPVLDAFEEAAAAATVRRPYLRMVSNVSGLLIERRDRPRGGTTSGWDQVMCDASYWRQHLRGAVRFSDGMDTLRREDIDVFLEIGLDGALLGLARSAIGTGSALWLPSLRKGRSDNQQLLESLARLYMFGGEIDWSGYTTHHRGKKVALPTYPFQRKRHWYRDESAGDAHHGPDVSLDALVEKLAYVEGLAEDDAAALLARHRGAAGDHNR